MNTTDHRISARVLAASRAPSGHVLCTWVVEFPWIILPELLTHRELSRNFMSLRAVPQAKIIAAVREAPFFFAHLGLAQRGMQALEDEVDSDERRRALMWWHELAQDAAHYAEALAGLGLHKQTVNRALMPFLYARGVVSATSRKPLGWPAENLFGVRASSRSVEPHMHELAWCMADAFKGADVVERVLGDWHLPFIKDHERALGDFPVQAMASAMRCARVSYGTVDGLNTTVEEDAAAARDRLMAPGDLHGSPFEHQATACGGSLQSNNFRGWFQHRQDLPGNVSSFGDEQYAKGRARTLQPGIEIDWLE